MMNEREGIRANRIMNNFITAAEMAIKNADPSLSIIVTVYVRDRDDTSKDYPDGYINFSHNSVGTTYDFTTFKGKVVNTF